MTYHNLKKELLAQGYTRIERDDRFFDVFLKETREKGIELWEKESGEELRLLRIQLPYNSKSLQKITIPRDSFERNLAQNTTDQLSNYPTSAQGNKALTEL